jgi:Fur family transcriptional regulator, ferric uptake regulator
MQYVPYMSKIELKRFKQLLRENDNFVTMPRLRLFGYLQSHPALTMKELIKLTSKHDQVTVYRNVDLFEKLGIINRIRLGWNTKIELSDIFQHHHHHISCSKCNKMWTLKEDPIIESQIEKLANIKGFKPLDHQLEIRGLCSSCSKTIKAKE